MQHHIDNRMFHVEILSPKQKSQKLEADLERFADKYRKVIAAGHVVCIPDNAMGLLAFQGVELIQELGLPSPGDQVSIAIQTGQPGGFRIAADHEEAAPDSRVIEKERETENE